MGFIPNRPFQEGEILLIPCGKYQYNSFNVGDILFPRLNGYKQRFKYKIISKISPDKWRKINNKLIPKWVDTHGIEVIIIH